MENSDTPYYPWLERLYTASGMDYGPNVPSGPALHSPEWLGLPAAGEAELLRQEERLGRRLPPSYRQFLQVSNGWDEYSTTSLRLLPIAEVDWTRDADPHLAHAWGPPPGSPIPELPADYSFNYEAPQNQDHFEVGDFLPHTLYISENVEGSVYLLNPHIVTTDGEWEAWFFDSIYLLNAIRFRSFWHLMEDAFHGNRH